jgi:peptide/nickel transport system ATP-binding protein
LSNFNSSETILSVRGLKTSFRISGEFYAAVDDVSLEVKKNEVFAIVGESGCGKSAMALSVMRLHNLVYTRIEGDIFFKNKNILKMSPGELNKIRGGEIGMIFQDPLSALNPLLRIGSQIEEGLKYHTELNKTQRKERAMELLMQVGMTDPALTYSSFPHELSGGMRQRAMIAIAISSKPSLLIADEPTTALDVTIQVQILDLMRQLIKEMQSSVILITHDLGVVAEMADRVAVMYAGQIVETASVYEIFENPKHPYTRSLLNSIPGTESESERLQTIQGMVPGLKEMPRTGCRFSHRIPWINKKSHEENPVYHEVSPEHFVLCSCYEDFRLD